jgi:hypothetical protein
MASAIHRVDLQAVFCEIVPRSHLAKGSSASLARQCAVISGVQAPSCVRRRIDLSRCFTHGLHCSRELTAGTARTSNQPDWQMRTLVSPVLRHSFLGIAYREDVPAWRDAGRRHSALSQQIEPRSSITFRRSRTIRVVSRRASVTQPLPGVLTPVRELIEIAVLQR